MVNGAIVVAFLGASLSCLIHIPHLKPCQNNNCEMIIRLITNAISSQDYLGGPIDIARAS
jgi:hypothetical protein